MKEKQNQNNPSFLVLSRSATSFTVEVLFLFLPFFLFEMLISWDMGNYMQDFINQTALHL